MSIPRRLALLGLLVLAWGATAALATGAVVRDLSDANDELQTYRDVQLAVAKLETAYLNQETGIRGYVLTGEPDFLVPYETGQDDADRTFPILERFVGESRVLAAHVDALRVAVATWHDEFAAPAIADVDRADVPRALERIRQGEGKARFDVVRDSLAIVDADIDLAVAKVDERRDELAQRLMGVLLATFVVGGIGYVLTVRVLRRWVTRPLGAIGEAADRISRGDLDAVVPMAGPGDVQRLGRSVDGMRREIVMRLRDAVRAREAVAQEATVVLGLQQGLSASMVELPDGWSIDADLVPAQGLVAGDCYDVLLLHSGRVGVFVLDISGHGAEVAVTALRCKEVVRAALRSGRDPAAALTFLADQLGETDGEFVTGVVAVLDPMSATLRWANAGHPPSVHRRRGGDVELGPTGPVVGPFTAHWTTEHAELAPGEWIVMYTDGLSEVRSAAGLRLGDAEVVSAVHGLPFGTPGRVVVDSLTGVAERFRFGPQVDDTTVVVISRRA